jgi:acyl transferase domain-containing protein/NADPH:quinone reductase-like Zn-dependent oxidoreductase/NAD(P)-dependent dehydrogenase (short-subunit alcohol dehydrogenase family)/acyl carrier protein
LRKSLIPKPIVTTDANSAGKFAIVGVGCRLPPSATSLAAFWRFLLRGGNALKSIRNKRDRWDWRQYFDENPARPGKTYAPKAAFLDADVRQFDPLAFGMSPREAASLDPQQRLLLEAAWEAFEDAGVPLERAAGAPIGVFVGGFCLDHLLLQAQPSNLPLINAHSAGGVMMTVLSNRISHAFDLRGPSLTLDTACSSSLVALHYACRSLAARECDAAFAGGVSVMTRPEFPIIMSKGRFLSHHGECHAYDESAAGYGRGEGAGLLLLKRLEDALAAGDSIYAVVRGSAVNQDGHTDGISLPNGEAQAALLERVYRDAGVSPAEVDYIEAHGTGTQAGDTAELGALNRQFAPGRQRKLIVGSVKTNIGHLEAAAGVAGVIKAIGVLKNRQVPKNLHFVHPNPKIPFAEYSLEVAAETKPLPAPEEKPVLVVGVNSFGYGGTNAHVILESAPRVEPAGGAETATANPPRVIPLSARSTEALRDLAGKYAFQLGQAAPGAFEDYAHTAAFRRSHLSHRAVAIAGSLEELRERWIALSTGQPHEGLVSGSGIASGGLPLVFVFTGMGPQWWAMGRELIENEPIVAATLDEIDAIFRPLAGWSLKEAMLAPEAESRMARTEVAQPANFALQLALTRLWEAHGVRPAAVVGHSVGEVTSAFVAGVYTLEEAVRISYHRSRLQQSVAGQGAMLAVGIAEAEAERLLADAPGVSIAAINSFGAVTLSGDTEQLRKIAADLEARGVFNKFLRVEVAYHSPQMDPLHDGLHAALADLAPRPARLPLYSTAHGRQIPGEEWDAGYWWRNVRQPVRFAAATQALLEDGFTAFLEVGPHPVLGNSIKECAAALERKVACFTSLRRAEPERPRFLLTLGELYCAGAEVDWSALAPTSGHFLPGPQYPWQRRTHWVESERSKMERLGLPGSVYLNRAVLAPRPTWEVEINRNYFPFLHDHGVQDQTVFAGLGYVESALSLCRKIHGKSAVVLDHVSFERVLVVDETKLQYLVTEYDAEGGRFIISSRVEGEEDNVLRHCRGRMTAQTEPRPGRLDLAALRAECPTPVPVDAFHEHLERCELFYGPAFRTITDVWVGGNCYFKKIDATASAAEEEHPLHPTLFDAAIRGVLYCAAGERLHVPFSFRQFEYFSRPDGECYAFGRLLGQSESMLVADVWLTDAKGNIHACARGMTLQAIDMKASRDEGALLHTVEWKSAPLEPGSNGGVSGAEVLVLADAADSDDALARELIERLPGAALERSLGTQPAPGRRRIVTLWGTKPASSAEAALALNEKLVAMLQTAAAAYPDGVEITVVTRDAKPVGDSGLNWPASSLSAVALVAHNEFESVVCRSLDLGAGDDAEAIVAELAAGSRGDAAVRDGGRFESRLCVFRKNSDGPAVAARSVEEPVALALGAKGRLESLHYAAAERREPGEGEIELRVHRVGLDDKDLLEVEGRVHPIAYEGALDGAGFGGEGAGVVLRAGPGSRFAPGDAVVARLASGFRSYATISDAFVEKIPPGLGMEAAGIPEDWLPAYHGLVDVARLAPGERVLVHHAASGPGLAAIEIARWIGAEILATAGSEEEGEFLREHGISRVYSSRTLDFGQRIREETGGEGVDVVIGAQAGQALHVSLGLLRTCGRCIELGRKDIVEDGSLPMRSFERAITFSAIDMDLLAKERPELVQRTLRAVLAHFEKGDFKPGPTRTFAARDIREAFEEMAGGRRIGKLLVDFSAGEVEVREAPAPIVRRDGCYIVTGGTAGFGATTALWLAEQGAGKVLLASRSGAKAPGVAEVAASLVDAGAEVEVISADVTDAAQARALVERAAPFRLRGIVHGAMVLDDAMMADMTPERFRRVFGPKVLGARNLADAVAGRLDLDFLVFYSSISALVGNRGQTSYVAANALLDGLAHEMRTRKVPAISINWGALAESGIVARDASLGGHLAAIGITGLGNRTAMMALEGALRLSPPQIGVFLVDWERWLDANPKLAGDPRFRELRETAGGGGDGAASEIRAALVEASREQRLRALEEHLQAVLAGTLKMAQDSVPLDRKLNEMGVDSLLVLELGLGIHERIGVNFSAMEFLKGPTLAQLATMAVERLWKN